VHPDLQIPGAPLAPSEIAAATRPRPMDRPESQHKEALLTAYVSKTTVDTLRLYAEEQRIVCECGNCRGRAGPSESEVI
jgi:hypothetical protein